MYCPLPRLQKGMWRMLSAAARCYSRPLLQLLLVGKAVDRWAGTEERHLLGVATINLPVWKCCHGSTVSEVFLASQPIQPCMYTAIQVFLLPHI